MKGKNMIEEEFSDTVSYAVDIYGSLDNNNSLDKTILSLYLSIIRKYEDVRFIFRTFNYEIEEYNIKELDADEAYNCFAQHFYPYLNDNGVTENLSCEYLMSILLKENIIKETNKQKNINHEMLEQYFPKPKIIKKIYNV